MDRDYEVGRGKPPKHTQFKKGNKAAARANRKRLPPPALIGEYILRYLSEEREVTTGGRVRCKPILYSLIQLILVESYKSSLRDKRLFLTFFKRWGLLDLSEELNARYWLRELHAQYEHERLVLRMEEISREYDADRQRQEDASLLISAAVQQCTCGVIADPAACMTMLGYYGP